MHIKYMARGFIDGSLSTLGIVIGAAIGGDPKVIMAAGLGGGIANAVSNLLGALTAEKAGVMKKLSKYEAAMVGSNINLKNTKIYDKEQKRIWISGILDSAFTFLGSVVPIAPFIFFSVSEAILYSIGITIFLLFILGMYLGKLSKENLVWAGTKMAIFGGVTAVLASSLEMFFR
jgi:predicted membrane protein (TIGR00267 family)